MRPPENVQALMRTTVRRAELGFPAADSIGPRPANPNHPPAALLGARGAPHHEEVAAIIRPCRQPTVSSSP